jgi:CheY-like chemotaxis protein
VLLDLNMPEATGSEVAHFIRKLELQKDIREPHYIVASSAIRDENITELSQKKIFTDFKMKPLKKDDIREILIIAKLLR